MRRSWEAAQEAVAAAAAFGGEHDAAAAAVAVVVVAAAAAVVAADGPHDGVDDVDAVVAASPAVSTPGRRASPPAARFSRPSSSWPRACATSPSGGTLCLGGGSDRICPLPASRCTDTWRASSWCTNGHSLLGCRRLRQSLAEAAPGPLSRAWDAKRSECLPKLMVQTRSTQVSCSGELESRSRDWDSLLRRGWRMKLSRWLINQGL